MLLCLLSGFMNLAVAEWDVDVQEKTHLKAGANFYRIRVQHEDGEFQMQGLLIDRAMFTTSIADQGVDRVEDARTIAQITRDHGAMIGVNGGYYTSAFRPDGLCVIDGTLLSKASSKSTLSCMFQIDGRGFPSLHWFNPSVSTSNSVLQCGPFLIEPGFRMGIHQSGGPVANRTILLQAKNLLGVFVTSEVSLYDLAYCLQFECRYTDFSEIDRVLNLDGGPSTGLCVFSEEKTFDLPSERPVRNVILFTPR